MSPVESGSVSDHLMRCLTGPSAVPRKNGELVFQAPWESRAFAMAVALCEQGLFSWDDFRAHLIAEIEQWDRANPTGDGYQYYERWVAALGNLLLELGVCHMREIEDQEEREQKIQLEGAA